MAKEKFVRTKPHMNVGTIGHVDHGKTTLSAAITKHSAQKYGDKALNYDEIDNAQKKKHGVLLLCKSPRVSIRQEHYAHIDCPGHADMLKT